MVTLNLCLCKPNHTREHFQPRPDLNVVQMRMNLRIMHYVVFFVKPFQCTEVVVKKKKILKPTNQTNKTKAETRK